MTRALGIDTLSFARKLKEAGAEDIGAVDMSKIATKSDLPTLEDEIKAAMADLKSDIVRSMLIAMAVQTALIVILIKLI